MTNEQKMRAKAALTALSPLIESHRAIVGSSDKKDAYAETHLVPIVIEHRGIAAELGAQVGAALQERALQAVRPFCCDDYEANVIVSNMHRCLVLRENARNLVSSSTAPHNAAPLARLIVKIITLALEAETFLGEVASK